MIFCNNKKSRKYFYSLSDKVDKNTEVLDKRIGDVQGVVTSISFRVDELCRSGDVGSKASSMDVARMIEKSNDRMLEHVTSSVQHIVTHMNVKLEESEEIVLSKMKTTMVDPRPVVMKNGKPATTGTCSICGTKMFKIGSSSK